MYCENPYSLSFESGFRGFVNQSCVKQSLVLDDEKGELVKFSGKTGAKSANGVSETTKAIAALKSHSEAEKRRRERINAHLATLRGLVPNNEKEHHGFRLHMRATSGRAVIKRRCEKG